MKRGRIPKAVVYRLSLYLRVLNDLSAEEVVQISSARFGRLVGVNPAQIRKDLAYFGQFGVKGVGYKVGELAGNIVRILGTDGLQNVALVGVGNLGRALLAYKGFSKRGFRIVAAFDSARVGQKTKKKGLIISDPRDLPRLVKQKKIMIGIIAVPASSALAVAEEMVRAGIKAILNFAPVSLRVPKGVKVENIDLSIGLEALSFSLKTHCGS